MLKFREVVMSARESAWQVRMMNVLVRQGSYVLLVGELGRKAGGKGKSVHYTASTTNRRGQEPTHSPLFREDLVHPGLVDDSRHPFSLPDARAKLIKRPLVSLRGPCELQQAREERKTYKGSIPSSRSQLSVPCTTPSQLGS